MEANGVANKRLRESNEPIIIGTHSGVFHCDEALACFMLKKLTEYKDAEIFRSRNTEQLQEKCHIIVDVGSIYDHEKKWYDHHQKSFQSTLSSLRPELGDEFKIRLSSAGLIYAHYGERVLASILESEANVSLKPELLKLCYVQIYRNFIAEIDAIDNGVNMYETDEKPLYKIHTGISSRVGLLNPQWDQPQMSDKEIDVLFTKAMALVGNEFVAKVLDMGKSWINAREIVREALLKAAEIYKTGEILLLERFCPWKTHLYELEKEHNSEGIPKLVIYKDTGDAWRVAGVPATPDSFLGRKFLPEPWRGLRDAELSQAVGVEGCLFAHHTGFIGGAASKEAALAMAIKSVEFNN